MSQELIVEIGDAFLRPRKVGVGVQRKERVLLFLGKYLVVEAKGAEHRFVTK